MMVPEPGCWMWVSPAREATLAKVRERAEALGVQL